MLSKTEIFNAIKVYWKASLSVAVVILLNVVLILLIGGARSDFLQKNEELNVLSAKRSNLMQLKRQFEDITATSERVEKSFINDENVVDFIVLVENTARNTGNEINIKSVSEQDRNGAKAFRIELLGSYTGFINFIAQMENSEKLAVPSKVDIREYVNSETKERSLKAILDIKALAI
jgi:hypothetical protein